VGYTLNGELGSFSFDVAKRVLDYLYEHGKSKKTKLATGTGLNYSVCMKYVKILAFLGWLEIDQLVQINERGRETRTKLSELDLALEKEDADEKGTMTTSQKQISNNYIDNITASSEASILLVDDEPDVALTFESFLTAAGYQVKVHTDSTQALRQFAIMPFQFELVILDIRMPDINGIKLYQILNGINPGCRVLFISSLDSARELVNSLTGISPTSIIKKPIDEKAFMKIVKATLNR
jgi:CheY-like chemotaxis protein/predicted transcriptional regulator